jgi:cell division protein FtsB
LSCKGINKNEIFVPLSIELLKSSVMKNWVKTFEKYSKKVNKYWIAIIIFAIITFFVGDSTILRRISYNKQIKQLESDIDYYTKEKEKNREKLNAIRSSDESLEKYAREQYLMTKPNEELFIISE